MKFLSAEGLQKLLSKLKNYIASSISEESQRLQQSLALPIGTVIHTAASTAPDGFLICNGQAVSRTEYADLFSAIGTKYGTGNGSSTFNVPNLIDKFIEGTGDSVGVSVAAGLPNITGSFHTPRQTNANSVSTTGSIRTGSASGQTNAIYGTTASAVMQLTVDIDASRSSSIYGKSSTVQPPAVKMLPCIKAVK